MFELGDWESSGRLPCTWGPQCFGGETGTVSRFSSQFLFTLSTRLVPEPNVSSILLGGDGLGVVYYLLVICYHNVKFCGAGMLTYLSNRIDIDWSWYWYICLLQLGCHPVAVVQYSTVQYSTVQYSTVQYSTIQYSTV